MGYPRSIDELSDGEILEEIAERARAIRNRKGRKLDDHTLRLWLFKALEDHNLLVASARNFKATRRVELNDEEREVVRKLALT